MKDLLLAAIVLLLPASTALAGEAAPWTLENEHLAITLGPDSHGAIVSLVDKLTGRELAAKPGDGLLFMLEFSGAEADPQKRLVLTNRDAQQIDCAPIPGEKAGLQLRFTQLGGRPIEVHCTVRPVEELPSLGWRLEADFPEPLVLETVRFPIVTLAVPAGEPADDALVLGATKGGVRRRFSASKVGTSVSATQPGTLAAQMACYYTPETGLIAAALDNRGFRKTIAAVRSAGGVSLQWHHACFARSRFVQEYDVALTTFHAAEPGRPADWRDGADLYKQWAVKQPWCQRTFAQRDDLPAWLKSGPAMVRFGRGWLAQSDDIETWLQKYWKQSFPADTPLIVAYWGWEKVDTWITPDYFPVYPSDEQFRHLAQVARELGGHTFVWPSGYHYTVTYQKLASGEFKWDDRSRFDSTARPHAVVGRNGQVIIGDRSWLQGGQTATMCPGDPWTIDWLNRLAVELAQRGAEMIQIDQVVGGAFPPCYSTDHGHPPGPGLWATEAIHRQLQTMLRQCRAVQSEAVVCFEEPNEMFIHEVGLQDYRDWEVLRGPGVEPASVFNYLYHEYLPTFQSNPQPGSKLQAAYCLVNGQIPHLIPSPQNGPGPLMAGGDFERWRDEAPRGWDHVHGYKDQAYTGKAFRDDAQKHSGQFSLQLVNHGADEIAQVSQNVRVGGTFIPGRTYRLRVWMKSSGLARPNGIGLGAFAGGMKHLGSWSVAMPKEASEWTASEVQFTLPQGTEMLRIMIHLNGPGTVWVDDITLEEIREGGEAVVVQRPTAPSDHTLMRQWVELFHGAGRPYLFLGTMLHLPQLEAGSIEFQGVTFPAILHNAFAAPDGSRAVVLVNVTDTPQTGKLTWNGSPREITLQPWEVQLLRTP
jgi:hypothetical protein